MPLIFTVVNLTKRIVWWFAVLTRFFNTLASIRLKSSSLHVFVRGNISATDCARELFKPLKDSASLRVCSEKNLLVLGFVFFVGDVISEVVLGLFGTLHLAIGPNC